MKPKQYSLSNIDVTAITTALSILPSYELISDEDFQNIYSLCTSAGIKLIEHKPLSEEETDIVLLAVDFADKAVRGEVYIDNDQLDELREYLFTYNKLLSNFKTLSHK